MKVIERIATQRPVAEVTETVARHLMAAYKQVDTVGSQAISASDPKDVTWVVKATATVERANDTWLVSVDGKHQMKAIWLVIMLGFALWQLLAGNFVLFLLLAAGFAIAPTFQARWREEKVTKALAAAKVELEVPPRSA